MKKITSLISLVVAVVLSGCLAHMRATNIADSLNVDAQKEGSPYRWYVVDLEGDKAKLEQRLIGNTVPTKVSQSKQQAILKNIEDRERSAGRVDKPVLKEVRLVNERQDKSIEAWIFESGGEEVAYSMEHTVGTDDQTFVVRGPWVKRP